MRHRSVTNQLDGRASRSPTVREFLGSLHRKHLLVILMQLLVLAAMLCRGTICHEGISEAQHRRSLHRLRVGHNRGSGRRSSLEEEWKVWWVEVGGRGPSF